MSTVWVTFCRVGPCARARWATRPVAAVARVAISARRGMCSISVSIPRTCRARAAELRGMADGARGLAVNYGAKTPVRLATWVAIASISGGDRQS